MNSLLKLAYQFRFASVKFADPFVLPEQTIVGVPAPDENQSAQLTKEIFSDIQELNQNSAAPDQIIEILDQILRRINQAKIDGQITDEQHSSLAEALTKKWREVASYPNQSNKEQTINTSKPSSIKMPLQDIGKMQNFLNQTTPNPRKDVEIAQRVLNELKSNDQIKFDPFLVIDGKLGTKTKEALNAYRQENNLPSWTDEQLIKSFYENNKERFNQLSQYKP